MGYTHSLIAKGSADRFAGLGVVYEMTVAFTVRSLWKLYNERGRFDVPAFAATVSYDEPQDLTSTPEAVVASWFEYAYVFDADATPGPVLRVMVAAWRKDRMAWVEIAAVRLDLPEDPAWDDLDRLAWSAVCPR